MKRRNANKPNANVDQQKAYHRLSLGGTSAYAGHLSSLVFGKIKSLWTDQTSANDGLNQLAKGMNLTIAVVIDVSLSFFFRLMFGLECVFLKIIRFRVWQPLTAPLSIFVVLLLLFFFFYLSRFLLLFYASGPSRWDHFFVGFSSSGCKQFADHCGVVMNICFIESHVRFLFYVFY